MSPGHPSRPHLGATPPPHLSAGLAKPPDLLRGSRLRKPPPGHPPRAGGGYGGGGGCDPNGPLHAPGRAAGGRGTSHAGAGGAGAGGAGSRSPRTKPREPGTRDSGEFGSRRAQGIAGAVTGARPRGRAPPRQGARARHPAGAAPANSTRGAGGGNRAAEAAAPRRPAPRQRVRAQPARSAAGGRAIPTSWGEGVRSGQALLLVPLLLALQGSPPRKGENSLCFGLGWGRMSCLSNSRSFP